MTICIMSGIQAWFRQRRQRKAKITTDARLLLSNDRETAFYAAQRLAARARFLHDRQGFMHWGAVAAEVARVSDERTQIDYAVVTEIVEQERIKTRPLA